MGHHLVLSVRFLGDVQGLARFHGLSHGAPEWPPAPARVFQAMVAGVARGAAIPEVIAQALEGLEALPPPVVAAPRALRGQRYSLFVPNNDADALEDPLDPSPIRTQKVVEASLFPAHDPLHYVWTLPEDFACTDTVVEAAHALYQLGRGVDLAWADAAVLEDDALERLLLHHSGEIHQPEAGEGGRRMPCPTAGSLDSLNRRYQTARLRVEGSGRDTRVLFTNPPKPRFQEVSYNREPRYTVYQLRDRIEGTPWPWPLGRVVKLVESLRDAAATRLRENLPELADQIERTLVGRKRDGSDALPIDQRVRIIPLPSIGFVHADRQVRRFLLQVPTGGRIPLADIAWAFSALDVSVGSRAGEEGLVAVRSDEDDMVSHYTGPARRWRTVTPVVLPRSAARRRIDPERYREEFKSAPERSMEEGQAVAAVHVALRHAGVRGVAQDVRVQREPFEGRGARAEVFADGTRFEKERLWHLEITFDRRVGGPLVIGDGRFLGLGLMAPAPD